MLINLNYLVVRSGALCSDEHWRPTVGSSLNNVNLLIEDRLADAAQGDDRACYELGMAYSTGTSGVVLDLIEAHKWFSLAAVAGHAEAAMCRADISDEMTAREVAEAQRRAREWIAASSRRAA